jgi:hypothetical protein
MQGHSGGGLSLGRGFPIMSATKQKLNTQSSMESELVGADDFMLAICWTRYFMEAQGFQIQDNVLIQQDNKSTIFLEKNRKALSSKHIKHVNIWYFFIAACVDKGKVSLVWWSGGLVSNRGHDRRLDDQTPTRCSVSSVQRSWEWFLHRIQDQESQNKGQ